MVVAKVLVLRHVPVVGRLAKQGAVAAAEVDVAADVAAVLAVVAAAAEMVAKEAVTSNAQFVGIAAGAEQTIQLLGLVTMLRVAVFARLCA